MCADAIPARRIYSWSGNGNIGDDWIQEVSSQYVDTETVRESRSIRRLGRHELRSIVRKPQESPLVLWGGGWLASDRPRSQTLKRWSAHMSKEKGSVAAFGIGVGPFDAGGPKEEKRLDKVLGMINHLSVRTAADLELVPGAYRAKLACDPTLLDKRFADAQWLETLRHGGRGRHDYAVFTMPRWRPHWQQHRPWLTESNYRTYVARALEDVGLPVKHVIFDSSTMDSDETYWSHLGLQVVRPRSTVDAAGVMANASKAICGRLHAAIMSALLGIPTLAIAYHHKFGVLEELGMQVAGAYEFHTASIDWHVADGRRIGEVRDRGTRVLSEMIRAG